MLNRDLGDAPDLDPDLLQALFDQNAEGWLIVGLQDEPRMSKLFYVLHNKAVDILVFASTLVWDAVAEDDLRAGASHYEALDELADADVLLDGLVTSGALLVLELGLALDVACRDEEIIQLYAGFFGRWTMLVLKTTSCDAKSAPVPIRDMTAASVLLQGLR